MAVTCPPVDPWNFGTHVLFPESARLIVATFLPFTVSIDLTSRARPSKLVLDTASDNLVNLSFKLKLESKDMLLTSLGSRKFIEANIN